MALVPRPRIAVVVAGNLRTWSECQNQEWMSEYDVFVSTYFCKYNYHPFIQSQLGPHEEEYLSHNDVIKAVEKRGVSWKCVEIATTERSEKEASFHPQMREIYHGYYQYLCVQRGLEMVRDHEERNGFKYDLIIRTRCDATYSSDQEWLSSLSEMKRDEGILNQSGHQPCDWFLVLPRDLMFDLCKYVLAQYFHPENEMCWQKPPHGLLENFLKRVSRVRMFPFCEIQRPSFTKSSQKS